MYSVVRQTVAVDWRTEDHCTLSCWVAHPSLLLDCQVFTNHESTDLLKKVQGVAPCLLTVSCYGSDEDV